MPKVCIIGGGAAGFFAAIHCKQNAPEAEVRILEKSRKLLAKVLVSGGGRCNVTHSCFDPKELVTRYPRGHRELLGPFHQWNPTHTIAWFEQRGVPTKTEADGRMFPQTNTSSTIADCLQEEARRLGVSVETETGLRDVEWNEETGQFDLELYDGSSTQTDFLMLATGGNKQAGGLKMAQKLGHRIIEPVPSLFTFHIDAPLLKELAGITVEKVETAIEGTRIQQDGPLLITHWGTSGPAILKLSAWGARELAERDYQFTLRINWLPDYTAVTLNEKIAQLRQQSGAQLIQKKSPFPGIPRRLWERMCQLSGIAQTTTWSQLSKSSGQSLCEFLINTRLPVNGKSMNKEEFVTCGGVSLKDVNMKTMESRRYPGLFFAGEVLDIDGVTGGFNFQAAWTGGYLAGTALASACAAR